jgi:hypothetical protein
MQPLLYAASMFYSFSIQKKLYQQEPCQHSHPPPNIFAHWKNVYVVDRNNSILRGVLVMQTDG